MIANRYDTYEKAHQLWNLFILILTLSFHFYISSEGSVFVDMTLIFNKESAVPTESRVVQVLKDAVDDLMTFLDVDSTTIAAGNYTSTIIILHQLLV